MSSSTNQGFSLIEVSIVLAVIALLLAGVTAGMKGAENATIRLAISEANKVISATEQFEQVYHYLPGDFPEAENYWTLGCDISIFPTNNGNGNWEIDSSYNGTWANEDNLVYRHLKFAGLFEMDWQCEKTLDPGLSIYASPYDGGAFWFAYSNNLHGVSSNTLTIAGIQGGLHDTMDRGVIKAKTAYAIDDKVDDKNPNTGYVQSTTGDSASGSCIDGSWSSTTSSYVLTDETNSCRVHFIYNLRP